MVFPDVPEVELCSSGSGQGGDCTNEVVLFSHRVDYSHDGILPIRLWEFGYKINANSAPGRICEGPKDAQKVQDSRIAV